MVMSQSLYITFKNSAKNPCHGGLRVGVYLCWPNATGHLPSEMPLGHGDSRIGPRALPAIVFNPKTVSHSFAGI